MNAIHAVEIKNAQKFYGSVEAVSHVSLSVPEGSVFGLIGPNGAGKTTTFSMLAGYVRPDSGDVFVLDHRPDNVAALRGRVGVLPQDALLPAGENVGDFLVYLARLQGIARAEARSAAEKSLHEVGGSAWWNVRCGTLSHGMAKRVGLAQAFLGNPAVVLLDEPTAGLDPRVAYEVRELVNVRKGTCTLIISSHNLHELEAICDHAAILDRGRLVGSGAMRELTASSEEVCITLGSGTSAWASLDAHQGVASLGDELRALAGVTTVAFSPKERELVVRLDKASADVEARTRQVLEVLLRHQAPIVGLRSGRSLEQRVMELTV